jgi:hypothetical protein
MTKHKPATDLSPDRIRYLALDPKARSVEYRSDPINRAKAAMYKITWRRNNCERNAAIDVVAQAIAKGRLDRGRCAGCGTDKFVCAYHDDDAKPYKVKWNCRRCHHASKLAQAAALAISIGNEVAGDQ